MHRHRIEIPELLNLYQIGPEQVSQACKLLSQAFSTDPIWKFLLKGQEEKAETVFHIPVLYALKYGKMYADSEQLNGMAAWLVPPYTQMSFWRLIRCGAVKFARQMGKELGKNTSKIFAIVEKDRAKNIKGPFLYLNSLGVIPSMQGQGLGTKLLTGMLQQRPEGIPLYLETNTERNVAFYEKFGFTVFKKITLPLVDSPLWEMILK